MQPVVLPLIFTVFKSYYNSNDNNNNNNNRSSSSNNNNSIIKRSFNSAGLQAHKMIPLVQFMRFKEVKCRSGATGGASLMLPVSNSDRSVHLPPPDLCLSLLRASTAGLTHQVKTTDTTGMFKENFASGICVHSSQYTYQKNSR